MLSVLVQLYLQILTVFNGFQCKAEPFDDVLCHILTKCTLLLLKDSHGLAYNTSNLCMGLMTSFINISNQHKTKESPNS